MGTDWRVSLSEGVGRGSDRLPSTFLNATSVWPLFFFSSTVQSCSAEEWPPGGRLLSGLARGGHSGLEGDGLNITEEGEGGKKTK